MIFTIGWRVVIVFFALSCMYIQVVVQEIQVVTKTAQLKQQQSTRSLLGRIPLLKQLETLSQSIAKFQ